MKSKKTKKITTSDTISMSIAQIPSISSHSSLPYVFEVGYLGKIYR
jgi:hypothetical protein